MNDDLGRLNDVLERATDAVEPRLDHTSVLSRARRRRQRQRAVGAGATAVAAVLVAVVSLQVAGDEQRTQELPPATRTPSVFTPEVGLDPRTVDSLPPAAADVAPLLPDVLEVPDVAPHVEDDPVDAAVLGVDDGADVLLLGTDGAWRCVVVDGKTEPSPVLSPQGTRLAVATVDGLVTVDLATGRRTHRQVPAGFEPRGANPGLWMLWLDEVRLLITDGDDEWVLDVDRGTDDRATESLVRAEVRVLGLPARPDEAARWDVRPVAELADGRWWLVQWDPVSGDNALVTSVAGDPDRSASIADDLVAAP